MKRIMNVLISVMVVIILVWTLIPGGSVKAVFSNSEIVPASINAQSSNTVVGDYHSDSRLLADDSDGLAFEVNVPWDQILLQPVSIEGKSYIQVSLPGWSATGDPGSPQLPFSVKQIGIPFGAGVELQVVLGPSHTLVLDAPVLPVVTRSIDLDLSNALTSSDGFPSAVDEYVEDGAVYGGAGYPGLLAEVTSDGVMRQQRIAGISVFPVQYNPSSQELVVYESMQISVKFSGMRSLDSGDARLESDAFESLFEGELLNYGTARQYRQPDLVFTPSLLELSAGIRAAGIPWTSPEPGWRIKVREDGFYKLTYTELSAAGVPVDSLDPRTIEMYNLGIPVAIKIEGETDGSFDSSDYILFYGQGIDSKYTRDNVYWLTYGEADVLRMTERDGTPQSASTPAYYPAQRDFEQDTVYMSQMPGDDDLERYYWNFVRPTVNLVPKSWTYSFTLPAPYIPAAATLKIRLLGFIESSINPDHHVVLTINDVQVGDTTWDGISWHEFEAVIPGNTLRASPETNILKVTCPNDTGVGYDVVVIDKFLLNYSKIFITENDELPFTTPEAGTWLYQVNGFTTDQGLAVFDVTTPEAVVQIINPVVSSVSPYSLQFSDATTGEARYWATNTARFRQVQGIESDVDTTSNLGMIANGADHLVISHSNFLTSAQRLSDFRASKGLRAQTVDVQDVYDEFNFGIVDPAAIRNFLEFAYSSWQPPAPSYVVLVGDGHYDPKNYLGFGRTNYIPAFLTFSDPWIGETATDNRYVTLAGADNLPDMMLGRLAVNSENEADAFINKIIDYESNPVSGDWQARVLAVADDADTGGDFAQISKALLTELLPSTYQLQEVYYGKTHSVVSEAQAAIQRAINDGVLIVNYIGHAQVNSWASEKLFKSTDVTLLTNGGKLPVMLPMTCMDGHYHRPDLSSSGLDAMAEVITRAEGKGAVASWSPTGFGVSTGHDYLNRGFYEALFHNNVSTLGGATSTGLLKLFTTGFSLDLLDTYLLFGDPATKMPVSVPQPAIPSGTITSRNPKFTWKPVEGATGYTLLIKQGETIIREEELTPATCTATACSYTFPVKLNLTNNPYTWTVKAYRGFWGSYGPAKSFTVVNPPAPRFPSVSATTPNPKFIWTKVADQTRYQIFLYTAEGTLVFKKLITSPVCGTTTCSFTPSPTLDLTLGNYKWKIQSYNGLWGAYSVLKSFNLVDPPEPIAPRGTIWNSNPTFSWTNINGATKYQLAIQTSAGANVRWVEVSSSTCVSNTCSYKPSPVLNLAQGTYKWKVRAFNGYYGLFSAYMSFTKK